MNCQVCQSEMTASRSNKRYCSERCKYRATAIRAGRRERVPPQDRGTVGASYFSVHRRLTAAFGPACSYVCVDCLGPAQEWAYDNADPDEASDAGSNLAYSVDLSHYEPRCKKCHRLFDCRSAGRAACGTEAGYGHHRRALKEAPCQPCKDAHAEAARRRLRAKELSNATPMETP